MNTVELDFILLEKVLNQLIMSDGMEVTHQYLIDKHIYYIDNTAIIEELEELIVTKFYDELYVSKGQVVYEELLEKYNPQFINFNKLYERLEKEYEQRFMESMDDEGGIEVNLNKYFLGEND